MDYFDQQGGAIKCNKLRKDGWPYISCVDVGDVVRNTKTGQLGKLVKRKGKKKYIVIDEEPEYFGSGINNASFFTMMGLTDRYLRKARAAREPSVDDAYKLIDSQSELIGQQAPVHQVDELPIQQVVSGRVSEIKPGMAAHRAALHQAPELQVQQVVPGRVSEVQPGMAAHRAAVHQAPELQVQQVVPGRVSEVQPGMAAHRAAVHQAPELQVQQVVPGRVSEVQPGMAAHRAAVHQAPELQVQQVVPGRVSEVQPGMAAHRAAVHQAPELQVQQVVPGRVSEVQPGMAAHRAAVHQAPELQVQQVVPGKVEEIKPGFASSDADLVAFAERKKIFQNEMKERKKVHQLEMGQMDRQIKEEEFQKQIQEQIKKAEALLEQQEAERVRLAREAELKRKADLKVARLEARKMAASQGADGVSIGQCDSGVKNECDWFSGSQYKPHQDGQRARALNLLMDTCMTKYGEDLSVLVDGNIASSAMRKNCETYQSRVGKIIAQLRQDEAKALQVEQERLAKKRAAEEQARQAKLKEEAAEKARLEAERETIRLAEEKKRMEIEVARQKAEHQRALEIRRRELQKKQEEEAEAQRLKQVARQKAQRELDQAAQIELDQAQADQVRTKQAREDAQKILKETEKAIAEANQHIQESNKMIAQAEAETKRREKEAENWRKEAQREKAEAERLAAAEKAKAAEEKAKAEQARFEAELLAKQLEDARIAEAEAAAEKKAAEDRARQLKKQEEQERKRFAEEEAARQRTEVEARKERERLAAEQAKRLAEQEAEAAHQADELKKKEKEAERRLLKDKRRAKRDKRNLENFPGLPSESLTDELGQPINFDDRLARAEKAVQDSAEEERLLEEQRVAAERRDQELKLAQEQLKIQQAAEEERKRQEAERLAQEQEEMEKKRLVELARQQAEAEQEAKEAAEKERIAHQIAEEKKKAEEVRLAKESRMEETRLKAAAKKCQDELTELNLTAAITEFSQASVGTMEEIDQWSQWFINKVRNINCLNEKKNELWEQIKQAVMTKKEEFKMYQKCITGLKNIEKQIDQFKNLTTDPTEKQIKVWEGQVYQLIEQSGCLNKHKANVIDQLKKVVHAKLSQLEEIDVPKAKDIEEDVGEGKMFGVQLISKTKEPELFDIKGEIGKGASGVIKKAIRRDDNNIYVLKYIKVDQSQFDPVILNEYKLLKRLSSICADSNIICYHDAMFVVDEDSNDVELLIQMDFIDGIDADYFMKNNKISAGGFRNKIFACRVVEGLLNALTLIHGNKIYHQDIKPNNIMLTPLQKITRFDLKKKYGAKDLIFTPTLIDFDLGCEQNSPDEDLTCDHNYAGNQMFMSPEKYDCFQKALIASNNNLSPNDACGLDEQIKNKADVWGVGLALWALLSDEGYHVVMGSRHHNDILNEIKKTKDFYPPNQTINNIIAQSLEFDYTKRPNAIQLLRLFKQDGECSNSNLMSLESIAREKLKGSLEDIVPESVKQVGPNPLINLINRVRDLIKDKEEKEMKYLTPNVFHNMIDKANETRQSAIDQGYELVVPIMDQVIDLSNQGKNLETSIRQKFKDGRQLIKEIRNAIFAKDENKAQRKYQQLTQIASEIDPLINRAKSSIKSATDTYNSVFAEAEEPVYERKVSDVSKTSGDEQFENIEMLKKKIHKPNKCADIKFERACEDERDLDCEWNNNQCIDRDTGGWDDDDDQLGYGYGKQMKKGEECLLL